MPVKLGHGVGGDAHGGGRPDDDVVAHVLELFGGEKRRAAEFGHIAHLRPRHGRSKSAEVLFRLQGIGKDDVGPGFLVEVGPFDRAFQPLDGGGVGAGDDAQMRTRLAGGADFGGGIFRRDQALVVQVAAFLRQHLVFDMYGARARAFQFPDRAHGVERFAITGVAVDDQRQVRGARHHAGDEAEFFQGQNTNVGKPHGRRHRAARDIQSLEPGLFGQHPGQTVMCAGNAKNLGSLD